MSSTSVLLLVLRHSCPVSAPALLISTSVLLISAPALLTSTSVLLISTSVLLISAPALLISTSVLLLVLRHSCLVSATTLLLHGQARPTQYFDTPVGAMAPQYCIVPSGT